MFLNPLRISPSPRINKLLIGQIRNSRSGIEPNVTTVFIAL